jgi:tRNA pseudouridine(55) synthase
MLYIYKPIGDTCGELVEKIKKENNYEKIAFCGRLDPMAHGKMLLLINDETKNITKYLQHNKQYEFKFIIGLSTDTTDTLGIFNNQNYNDNIDIDQIINYIDNIKLNEKFKQKYHNFSSYTPSEKINKQKKPLWYWTINNLKTNDYYKDVIIYDLQILEINYLHIKNIINEAINNINKINDKNSFRIPEILKQYETIKDNNMIKEIKILITVSSGFYIRQFVQDISDYFKVKMLVTEIYRKKIF